MTTSLDFPTSPSRVCWDAYLAHKAARRTLVAYLAACDAEAADPLLQDRVPCRVLNRLDTVTLLVGAEHDARALLATALAALRAAEHDDGLTVPSAPAEWAA